MYVTFKSCINLFMIFYILNRLYLRNRKLHQPSIYASKRRFVRCLVYPLFAADFINDYTTFIEFHTPYLPIKQHISEVTI